MFCLSEWTTQQRALNARRKAQWLRFNQWEARLREAKKQKRVARQQQQRQRQQQRHQDQQHNTAKPAADIQHSPTQGGGNHKPSQSAYSQIDWANLVEEEKLERLTTREAMLYFKEHRITVPDTRQQMLSTIRAHYFFAQMKLNKQKNKLYRLSD